jgi:hypothetical protein
VIQSITLSQVVSEIAAVPGTPEEVLPSGTVPAVDAVPARTVVSQSVHIVSVAPDGRTTAFHDTAPPAEIVAALVAYAAGLVPQ